MFKRIWKTVENGISAEQKGSLYVYDAGNLQGILHPSLGWKLYVILSREKLPDGTIQEICSECDCIPLHFYSITSYPLQGLSQSWSHLQFGSQSVSVFQSPYQSEQQLSQPPPRPSQPYQRGVRSQLQQQGESRQQHPKPVLRQAQPKKQGSRRHEGPPKFQRKESS